MKKFDVKSIVLGILLGTVGITTVFATNDIKSVTLNNAKIMFGDVYAPLNSSLVLIEKNGEEDAKLYMPVREIFEYLGYQVEFDSKSNALKLNSPEQSIDLPKFQSNSITGSSDGVSDFLSLQKEFISGDSNDICYNITPQYIAENSDFRIFKYDTSCASFLLYDNEIFPMGEWFGGFGVTDMKLADINNDNELELYFTFSWGSGIHRSQVGYFNPKSKEIVIFDYSHMNEDMAIVTNNKNGLSLYQATISQIENFTNFGIEVDDYIADIVFEDNSIALSFPAQ